jgi:hypothetical protein
MTVNNVNAPNRNSSSTSWIVAAIVACAALLAFFYFAAPQTAQRDVENNITIEQPDKVQPPEANAPQGENIPQAAPPAHQEGTQTAPAN